MRLKYKFLFKNFPGVFLIKLVPAISFFIIFLYSFLAIFAYYVIPQNTSMSNQIELSLANKPPGFIIEYIYLYDENIKYYPGSCERSKAENFLIENASFIEY